MSYLIGVRGPALKLNEDFDIQEFDVLLIEPNLRKSKTYLGYYEQIV